MVDSRAWGMGNGEFVFMGREFQLYKMREFWGWMVVVVA